MQFVTATHDVNNPASGYVMRAVGMKYMYSYEELWQPKNFKVIFRMYQLNLDGDASRIYQKYWRCIQIISSKRCRDIERSETRMGFRPIF